MKNVVNDTGIMDGREITIAIVSSSPGSQSSQIVVLGAFALQAFYCSSPHEPPSDWAG